MLMRFSHCALIVNDMDESLNFYQEIVGLKLEQRFMVEPEVELSILGEEETKIELIHHKNKAQIAGHGEGITIGFQVRSIEEMYTFVKDKGLKPTEIFQPVPDVRFFYVQDPNGYNVEFIEFGPT
ncbi:MAG: VOC family protein [Desulfitobacteriia bacterium]|jgi:lactoylglutathione lyase